MKTLPYLTRADVPTDWIEERRVLIARDGFALRAGPLGRIEIKTQRPAPTVNTWVTLTLPGGALGFVKDADRDAVLRLLQAPGPSALNAQPSTSAS